MMMKQVAVNLPPDVIKRLDRIATRRKRSNHFINRSDVIRECLMHGLDEAETNEAAEGKSGG